ncbi:hypothetical protein DFH09DRAFT_1301303 [Mycena vulgaris]|nr:hypothetical protein DFH09DRAFT_1301303 [Mycena vulgaris]
MAYHGQFAPTSGPNDPHIPSLTPQQYALAVQHFQYQQQMQMATPPQPLHLPLPGSVIDPSLLSVQDQTMDDRLHALERDIQEMKAQKRSNSRIEEGSSKRRKKAPKSFPYILKNATGLSKKQMEVRNQLRIKGRVARRSDGGGGSGGATTPTTTLASPISESRAETPVTFA